MSNVYREASGNVVVRSNRTNSDLGIALRCFHQWGGCPLEFWSEPNPGPLTNPFPGSAFNPTCETGQDPTQASSDGMTPNPIARIGNGPSIARNNYYIRERELSQTRYSIDGFFPVFWLSHESIDDVIVPILNNQDDGWRTRYRPGPFYGLLQMTPTAVYLQSTPANRNVGGYFAPGMETQFGAPASLWPDRLFGIPDGRMAARVTVSLANAQGDGACAGFAFRKLIPRLASDVAYVSGSQGYLFRVTKTGIWELVGGAVPDARIAYGRLTSAEKTALSHAGLELELRTHNGLPGHVELYISNRLVFVSNNLSVDGPYFFLYGRAPSGFICFDQRRLYDVSIDSHVTLEPLPNAVIRYSVSFNVVPEAGPRPFYRTNMNFFMSPTIFPPAERSTGCKLPDGTFIERQGVTGIELPEMGLIKSLWVGNKTQTIGLSASLIAMRVDGVDTLMTGAHAQVQHEGANNEFVMGINALAIRNNSAPRSCRNVELVVDLRDSL